MNNVEDVERLEKLIGQLQGAHNELSLLAKKSPNDALNPFKLKLINSVLKSANTVLGPSYKPFDDFDEFDADDVPSNSDVTMVLSQYMEEAERFRSDNVMRSGAWWYYIIGNQQSDIKSGAPSKVGKK